MSTNDPAQVQHADKDDAKRGPNTEAVDTAQKNVTEGYGSPGKASIMSGKPDKGTDAEATRAKDEQGAPSKGG